MIDRISIVIVLLSLLSCQQHVDKEAVKEEVLLMFQDYYQKMSENGAKSGIEFLDNSPDFFWAPPGFNIALSYDSTFSLIWNNPEIRYEYQWDTVQVFPISQNLASFTGILRQTGSDSTGNETVFLILESGSVIKRSDGWKLLNGQSRIIDTSPVAKKVQP
jgi:hypothetical protein